MIPTERYDELLIVNDLHISTGADNGTRITTHSPALLEDFVNIANSEKPKAVLLLGDICQSPSDWNTFNTIWSKVDQTINKYVTVGNHDYDDTSLSQLESVLGVENMPLIGGSRFNKTFSLNEKTRIIVVDSSFDVNDVQGSHYENLRIHSSSVSWIENLLLNSAEKNFVIATHCIPHLVGYFNEAQRNQIKAMIDAVLITRPGIKVSWIGGHQHELHARIFENMGIHQKGYLLPSLIETADGRYTVLRISDTGEVSADKVEILYNS